ncbi:MAG: AI-2E family transporter [Planctomycetes bacterium]|nr:AI-2E family transporter [Planctomycetota bacterium]
MSNSHTIIVNFNRNFFLHSLKWLFVCLILGLAITLLVVIKTLLFTCIISVLLAFLLEPVVRFAENYDIKRTTAIVIVFVSIAIIITFGVALFLPVVTTEIQSISANLQLKHPSVLTDEFKTTIEEKFPLMKQRGLSEELASYLRNTLDNLIEKSMEILFEFVHIVSMMFTVPVFTFFLLKDGQRIKKSLIQLVPNRYFEMTLSLVHKISHQMGSYIRGRLLDALIVGILCTITLYLLNIPYAFLIGSLAGCANIIPHFGPVVGAIPAIVMALMKTGSFASVLVITISFVAIQLFDHLVISHMFVLKNIHMHPIIVFIVIFIGGYLMGALGMFIGVLFASVLKVTIDELLWSFKHYRIFGHTPHSAPH